MAERLFLAVPQGCLQFVIVVFPDHTHLLFLSKAADIRCSVITYVSLRNTPFSYHKVPSEVSNMRNVCHKVSYIEKYTLFQS